MSKLLMDQWIEFAGSAGQPLSGSTRYPTRYRRPDPISKELSCTSMCLPVPVSRYFSISAPLDTEEVVGSNPIAPTIYFQWFTSPEAIPFHPRFHPKLLNCLGFIAEDCIQHREFSAVLRDVG